MAIRKVFQSEKYQLRLVEYPRSRRYEIQGWDLEDGEWVKNLTGTVKGYDYYRAMETLMNEVRTLQNEGVEFTDVWFGK